MNGLNKNNDKIKENVAVAKTDKVKVKNPIDNKKVEKVKVKENKEVRKIMVKSDGKRVHSMNINMKNKILEKVNWSKDKVFGKQKDNILKISSNKHFKRMLSELKKYELKKEDVVANNGLVTGARSRYYIGVRNNVNYLVENDKDRCVKHFVEIIN